MARDYEMQLDDLATTLGYTGGATDNLRLALTTKAQDNRIGQNNERLEFLGDAVIQLAVTEYLYDRDNSSNEGAMTKARTDLVSNDTLARILRDILNIDALILNGPTPVQGDAPALTKLRGGVIEAIVGAVYLDEGYAGASEVVAQFIQWFEANRANIRSKAQGRNSKGELQEFLAKEPFKSAQPRKRGGAVQELTYKLERTLPPDHDPTHVVSVAIYVPDYMLPRNQSNPLRFTGETRGGVKAAELAAATAALEWLKNARRQNHWFHRKERPN